MRLTLCTTLLLVSVGLSGCFGGDDDSPDAGGTVGGDVTDGGDLGNLTDGTGASVSVAVNISVTTVPEEVLAGQNATFGWSLDGQAGNDTVSTGIVWSTTSIANESTPDMAENNQVVDNATVPGTFEADITFETTGDYFVRMYAVLGENVTWGEELNLTVEAELVIKEVKIKGATFAHMAAFSPEQVKIKVGEAVVWINEDDEAHHVVSTSGSAIDTGSLAAGASSEAIVFDTAGTYAYECKLHDGFGVEHNGSVVVE